jgi:hypothetical protein
MKSILRALDAVSSVAGQMSSASVFRPTHDSANGRNEVELERSIGIIFEILFPDYLPNEKLD